MVEAYYNVAAESAERNHAVGVATDGLQCLTVHVLLRVAFFVFRDYVDILSGGRTVVEHFCHIR